jgi:hypothetical protein
VPRRPSQLFLALRGSGQGLYVGLADDCFVVASEPYGVVEETSRYVDGEMDGEQGGEIVVLDGDRAGELAGIGRFAYDGTPRRSTTPTSFAPRSPPATSTAATPPTSCSRRSARRRSASARPCGARSSTRRPPPRRLGDGRSPTTSPGSPPARSRGSG